MSASIELSPSPIERFGPRHVLLAAMGAALGMGTRGLLNAWFGDALPFAFALPAVCVVGWLAGVGAAAITVLLSVVWLLVPWLVPTLTPELGWRPALYFVPSGLILGFFAARLRALLQPAGVAPEAEQFSGLGWLWAAILLGGAIPLAMFVAAGVSLYQQALAEANLRVERAARIGEEHALKVFETNMALLNRIVDAMGDDADAQLLAREPQLHQQLKRMSANLAQLQGIFLIDSAGRMVATNRAFPAPHDTDFSDRPAFRHHRGGGAQPFISDVLTSRTTGEPFFDLSLRRSRQDGSFGGTVSTSMAPAYFAAFYREISSEPASVSISLLRADGALLAGWPHSPQPGDVNAAPADARPAPAVGTTTGAAPAATRKVGAFPVFVSVQMERHATLAAWYGQMVLMLALTFPAASGLMYIGWVALKRTRHALQVADSLRQETLNRKKVEDSLRQAQKMEAVGQLTGGIAHDFNNLLQVISANLHLIGRELPGDAALQRRLANAREAVQRGARLASQLLSFGRRQALEPRVVNVGTLVSGMTDMLGRALGEAVEVRLVAPPGLWNTFADPHQIENAILNLAINARDAMHGAGTLTIEVANAALDEAAADADAREHGDLSAGEYVLVVVRDTGVGMSPEVVAQAFEPFFTTKPPGAGSGLGLSMVYGFVKQSGGHVKIHSDVGRGTAISLYLPRSRRSEPEGPAAAPESASVSVLGGRETVLVVEDDAPLRSATVETLAALGYRVLGAADADAAMAIIDSGVPVDLLFTDVVMPGKLRSPELAQKARRRLPRLAVLYTSGHVQAGIVHGGRLDEGVELLGKPYTADALARKVRAMLNPAIVQATKEQEAPMAEPQEKTLAPKRPTVLLVEDDDLIRSSTAEMVRELGYEVVEARSAEAAIGFIEKEEIGILIVDVGLPGVSGDVFAAEVQGMRPMAIIFATGNPHVHGAEADSGGPILLLKPYDMAAIEAALQAAMRRVRAGR